MSPLIQNSRVETRSSLLNIVVMSEGSRDLSHHEYTGG